MLRPLPVLLLLPVILVVSSELPGKLHISHNRTERDKECYEDEYRHRDKCCRTCLAGTRVSAHCTENHARGVCEACTPGESYIAGPSGMEECLPCLVCKDDKVMVQECTPKTDRICECKPGYYCIPEEPCEICSRCSRCGKGLRIKEQCTPTSNTVCEDLSAPPEPTSTKATVKEEHTEPTDPPDRPSVSKTDPVVAAIVVPLLLILIAVLVWLYCRRRDGKKAKTENSLIGTANTSESTLASVHIEGRDREEVSRPPEHQQLLPPEDDGRVENEVNQQAARYGGLPGARSEPEENSIAEPLEGDAEEEESPQLGEPCPECGMAQPCDQQWDAFIYKIIDHVPQNRILQLVRELHLHRATIDQILNDIPNNSKEQNYKLLSQWRNQKGKQASMKAVLSKLKDMGLGGCCENIVNTVRAKIPMN
ncbi:tumor necrosis factor receptor superfamily member 10B-like isoform X2 [Eleutherodactylus coqui]|uniref:tumor necrosis factor receptor superfamily member 10B-like isoform X2 n=1 Tax=Eleutherodactylus coqui TaxID=57060 RepID=UPI003462F6C6